MLSLPHLALLALSLLSPADARAITGSGSSNADPFKLKHALQAPPRGWTRLADAPSTHPIRLRIGLKQPHLDSVREHLSASSDPSHARYGQHLSLEDLNALTAPAEASVKAVYDWLDTHGVDREACVENNENDGGAKDWVIVNLPVGTVERMLDAKYGVYTSSSSSSSERLGHVLTESYSLPESLHEHVDVVAPTTYFSSIRPEASTVRIKLGASIGTPTDLGTAVGSGSVPAGCNTSLVTNECLREFYGTIDYVPKAADKQFIGVTGYLGETAIKTDLALFLKDQRPDAQGHTFDVTLVHGGQDPQTLNATQIQNGVGIEADLDTQTVFGVDFPIPEMFYSTGGSPPIKFDDNTPTNTNEPYLDWLNFILAQKNLPGVVTTSYGDDEQTVPEDYAKRVCDGFMQLGARGVTVVFSSGDSGVGNPGVCFTNDGKNTPTFLPAFPAGCPYVTTVGATMNFNPEVAVNDTVDFTEPFFSGGGFSNYFPAPSYQKATVSAYVAGLDGLHKGLFNPAGRGYPDVAAQGSNFKIAWQGVHGFTPVSGTSASSPLFASVLGLLNDVRLSAGLPTLGFINPWLYSIGHEGLNDIVNGASQGCNTTGFPAKHGWDAVSGWGTPNFKLLSKLALVEHNGLSDEGNGGISISI